jgi:FMN phosphatase YigB (HAD superfamily)
MEINGKTYKYIFWDWLWTLYDGNNAKLFDWVVPTFERMKDVKHFLVSWTSNIDKRSGEIELSPLRKYLTKVYVVNVSKDLSFRNLIKEFNIPIEDLIVIGDSYTNEIPTAKALGIDWIHITDFVDQLPAEK